MFHLSHCICHISFVTLHLSHCICHIIFVTLHLSHYICHIAFVSLYLSHCISHIAFVTLQLSHCICYLSHYIFHSASVFRCVSISINLKFTPRQTDTQLCSEQFRTGQVRTGDLRIYGFMDLRI